MAFKIVDSIDCCTFCIISYHYINLSFDMKSCYVIVRFDPLICIHIHFSSIASVQTSGIQQAFWSIDSLINSLHFLKEVAKHRQSKINK